MADGTGRGSLVTIVVPVRNEEGSLPELYQRLTEVLGRVDDHVFEILAIDNGSFDRSGAILRDFAKRDPRWRYIQFSRDFGIEASFFAGAEYARGEALIYLFSDLQDPPEEIPNMIKKWQEGYDVVYGVLKRREDGMPLKSLGAYWAYRLIYFLSDATIPINATDYRLVSRPVIEALRACGERSRYMRGLTHWAGFRQTSFEFERAPRKHGVSDAGLVFCLKYALSAIFSFSDKPIRLASVVGVLTMLVSILGGIGYTILTILTRAEIWKIAAPPTGITTIVLLVFFFGGLQCLFMGILGEYLTQVHVEAKNRPMWLIRDSFGLETSRFSVHQGDRLPERSELGDGIAAGPLASWTRVAGDPEAQEGDDGLRDVSRTRSAEVVEGGRAGWIGPKH